MIARASENHADDGDVVGRRMSEFEIVNDGDDATSQN